MKIWWCQAHETANRLNTLGCWIGYDLWEESGKREDPGCQLVPMRLIPDNALTPAEYLEQERNDDLRRALGKGRYAPWERDIERLLNRSDAILAAQFGFAGDRITNVTMVANLDYRRDPIETRRLMGADQAGETP